LIQGELEDNTRRGKNKRERSREKEKG